MPYDPTVAQLQQQLNAEGYRDPQGRPLAVDGIMGPLTQYALQQKASTAASTVDPSIVDPMYSGKWTTPGITGTIYTAPDVRIEGGNIVASRDGQIVSSTPIPGASAGGTAPPSMPSAPAAVGSLGTQMGSLLSQLQGMSFTPNLPSSLTAYNPQIGTLMSSLQAKASAPLPAPETTPQYQAAKARLQQEGTEASTRAVQQMAARGVLRSSMTEEALKNIERNIVDMLTTQVTPQVQQQLWQERQAELGGLRSDLQTAIDMARVDAERALQLAQMEQQARQFGMTYGLDAERLMQEAQQFQQQLQWAREQYGLEAAQQTGRDALANLYNIANLTGTIPAGLPGAGGLTADEAYRRAQLARSTASSAPSLTSTIRDTLLRGLNEGTIKEEDLQPWQREILGLPQIKPDEGGSEVLATVVAGLQEVGAAAKTAQQRELARQSELRDIEALRVGGFLTGQEYQRALQLLDMYLPAAVLPTATMPTGNSVGGWTVPLEYGSPTKE